MLINIFCHTKFEVMDMVNMLYNHLGNKIEFCEIREMKYIKDGYYRHALRMNQDEISKDLDVNFNENRDNVAVVYNSGQKIFVSIYKDAKISPENYKDF